MGVCCVGDLWWSLGIEGGWCVRFGGVMVLGEEWGKVVWVWRVVEVVDNFMCWIGIGV